MKKNLIFILLITIILAGAGIWYANNRGEESPSPSLIAQVTFVCDGDKTIDAAFYGGEPQPAEPGEPPIPSGSVKIILSDGRNFDLPQTISASGVRYANEDENFIFWTKGDSAFIEEGGEFTFQNCLLDESGNN
jgi:hypothetical protein